MSERTFRRSELIGLLATAMAKAQGQIKGAVRDSANPDFKSKYADLASVRGACAEALSKNELAVFQFPRATEEGVEVETLLAHSSGQWLAETLTMPVAKADAHGLGSAITYARRYALAAIVGVAPEDDDGNAAASSSGKLRQTAMMILKPAAAKGLGDLELAWKSISSEMRSACSKDLPVLKEEANAAVTA